MSLCYKTTEGNKVSIDYQMNYYEWKDVREYVWWDSNFCSVYCDLGRDYIEIDETVLSKDEISYLLGNKDFMEDRDEDERVSREKHMKDLQDQIIITYFKIADLGSSWLYMRWTSDPEEANGFVMKKKWIDEKLDQNELKETFDYFRAYVEGTFVEISIYSPTTYIAENDPTNKITKYDYEDWERFFRSNEEAIASVDEKVWWKVLKETESEIFSMREY